MSRHAAPSLRSPCGDRRRLMLFSTAILCVVSLSAVLLAALHFRPSIVDGDPSRQAWQRRLMLNLGETLVLVIAGGTLLVRVCNPFNRRLEESDGRLRAIVSTAGDGVITLDERGTIKSFNRAAERMIGRSETSMLARNIDELILLASGKSFAHELPACRWPEGPASQKGVGRAGGTVFPLELSLGRVASGENALLTVILRDTTERETAQQHLRSQMIKLGEVKENLEAKAAQLAKTNRDLDDFTYIASHDLKEPLRGISAYCQILLEDYGERLDADGQRRLPALVGLCQRLSRLIDEVLAYSRIGRKQPEASQADLGAIVDDVLETLGPAIDRRTARVPARVLLDLNIPGTSGRELLAIIKSDPLLGGIPVVVLSTSTHRSDAEFCYRTGANSYHSKPDDFDRYQQLLAQIVEYWLEAVVPSGGHAESTIDQSASVG